MKVGFFFFLILVSACFLSTGCKTQGESDDMGQNIDTLKVVTLYGPTSYFDYRGEIMGIDYENVKKFAEDEGMELEVTPMHTVMDLIEALKEEFLKA